MRKTAFCLVAVLLLYGKVSIETSALQAASPAAPAVRTTSVAPAAPATPAARTTSVAPAASATQTVSVATEALAAPVAAATEWPAVRPENKPGTRWWWLGSAVDKENLDWNLHYLHQAGIGSVEITPIYGVQGEEARDIPYLSPRWMEMLKHVQDQAARLEMIVDMNGGTGWPFGGPEIDPAYAASRQLIQRYELEGISVSPSAGSKSAPTQSINLQVKDNRQRPHAQLQALLFVSADGSREILPIEGVKDNILELPAGKKGNES